MTKFALKKIEAIAGKQDFYELLINEKSQFESFIVEIKRSTQLMSEVRTILSYMNHVSELNQYLPKTKFRDITPVKEETKEYEFKSKHLRVYVFHLEKTGKIVSLWGFKKNQNQDIHAFRLIKKQFLKSYTP